MATLPSNLPKLLRQAGVRVVVLPGWKTRGRPAYTGGYAGEDAGVLWHHTGAKSRGWSRVKELAYAKWMGLTGRSDLPAPLCQLSIGASGIVYVIAAGRGNHAGKAKASGTMAEGDGNYLYTGVECMNSGTEGWSDAQLDSMVKVGLVLAGINGYSFEAQRAHYETSVTGKWDPGDPSGIQLGNVRVMDMDAFRDRMAKAAAAAARSGGDNARAVPQRGIAAGWKKATGRTAVARAHDWALLALVRAENEAAEAGKVAEGATAAARRAAKKQAARHRRARRLNKVLEQLPGSKKRRS